MLTHESKFGDQVAYIGWVDTYRSSSGLNRNELGFLDWFYMRRKPRKTFLSHYNHHYGLKRKRELIPAGFYRFATPHLITRGLLNGCTAQLYGARFTNDLTRHNNRLLIRKRTKMMNYGRCRMIFRSYGRDLK